MQIWNSAALWLLLWCVTLNNIKLIPCFYLVLALSFIVYSTECWFINVNSFLLLFSFYLVLAFLFICLIFFEFESLGSQTHESQTRWPTSILACITSCSYFPPMFSLFQSQSQFEVYFTIMKNTQIQTEQEMK